MSAVYGPHLQTSTGEKVDQRSAVCNEKTVCFFYFYKNLVLLTNTHNTTANLSLSLLSFTTTTTTTIRHNLLHRPPPPPPPPPPSTCHHRLAPRRNPQLPPALSLLWPLSLPLSDPSPPYATTNRWWPTVRLRDATGKCGCGFDVRPPEDGEIDGADMCCCVRVTDIWCVVSEMTESNFKEICRGKFLMARVLKMKVK
ncbi:hypothetical protein HanIR_Chr12g0613641 [Helianthus annuus]|nr:hypothetical protein HanIR_Chr12g0613641 [Helianthus annuus]